MHNLHEPNSDFSQRLDIKGTEILSRHDLEQLKAIT